MEKKFYEIPQVESYQMDVEAGYTSSTEEFDGPWVSIV